MKEETTEALRMILLDPLTALGHQIVSVIPSILGAIALLAAGYFIAKFFSFVTKKFVQKINLDTLADKAGLTKFLSFIDDNLTLSKVLSIIVYYIILLTFIMSAVEALNMKIMADALKSILLYLPNIIASIFVLMFGFFIANNAKSVVSKSASGMNIEFSDSLGKLVYGLVAVISVSLAIGQLDIETTLLNQAASIILIAIGTALALSLGLGTKELSSIILAGNYVRDIYNVGDTITVDGLSGEILSIGTTKTILITKENKEVSISNDVILKSNITKG
ncbi:mechanosensitive ion channel [bacterium]|nr:mechanosensitive ion channel [bacterium]MBU1990634.1 mechanosensitive ion channel [bacterium]